jgi:hypothetical protein
LRAADHGREIKIYIFYGQDRRKVGGRVARFFLGTKIPKYILTYQRNTNYTKCPYIKYIKYQYNIQKILSKALKNIPKLGHLATLVGKTAGQIRE